jgi:hypothetical protein
MVMDSGLPGRKFDLQDLILEIDNTSDCPSSPALCGLAKKYLMEIIWKRDLHSLETIYSLVSEEARTGFCDLTIVQESLPLDLEGLCFRPELLRDCHFRFLPILAAMFNASDIVRFYFKTFPDKVLQTTDVGNANIIHALIFGSYLQVKKEEEYVKLYQVIMEYYQDHEQRRIILHGEIADGLRPLELASRLGQYRLVMAILETTGIYRLDESQAGPFQKVNYNMSDYQPLCSRYHLSPLVDLLAITSKELTAVAEAGLMRTPLFESLWKETYKRNRPFIIAWIVFRVCIVCFMYLTSDQSDELFLYIDYVLRTRDIDLSYLRTLKKGIDTSPQNITDLVFSSVYTQLSAKHAKVISCQYITLDLNEFVSRTEGVNIIPVPMIGVMFCVLGPLFGFDVCDVIMTLVKYVRNGHYRRKFARKGGYVVSNVFYRISTSIMVGGYLMIFSYGLALQYGAIKDALSFHAMTACSVLAYGAAKVVTVWSILYFLQLLPGLGGFVIGFQRMMMALCQFLVVFCIIFGSFAFAFSDILRLDCTKDKFANKPQAFYSSFLMMLNMVNLSDYNIMTLYLVQILHVAFIIIVTILLVNFLIALMANKHTEMTQYGDLIFQLYRLDVAMTVERRLAKLRKVVRSRTAMKDGIIAVTIIGSRK